MDICSPGFTHASLSSGPVIPPRALQQRLVRTLGQGVRQAIGEIQRCRMAALAVGQPGLRRQIDQVGIDRNDVGLDLAEPKKTDIAAA